MEERATGGAVAKILATDAGSASLATTRPVPRFGEDRARLFDLVSLLRKVGSDAILYHAFAFDDQVPNAWLEKALGERSNRLDYNHCMFGVDFFEWLMGGPEVLSEKYTVNDWHDVRTHEDPHGGYYDQTKTRDFLRVLAFEPYRLYACYYQFDIVSHFFAVVTTPEHLVILNTCESAKGRLEISVRDADVGTAVLKRALSGDMRAYQDIFGFEVPPEQIDERLEVFDINVRERHLVVPTRERLAAALREIRDALKHEADRQDFCRAVGGAIGKGV